jgi:hypothetical protein
MELAAFAPTLYRVIKLTIQFHLVPRLRMSGAIPHFPVYV